MVLVVASNRGIVSYLLCRAGSIKWHWSNQDSIKYIKQIGVSHDTLVQEEKYLSQSRHVWQGDPLKTSFLVTHNQKSCVCRAEPPIDKGDFLGKFLTCHQGSQDIYQRPRRVEYTTFKCIPEADPRPLLRQPSSTHQDAVPRHADLLTAMLLEALPCWAEDFV